MLSEPRRRWTYYLTCGRIPYVFLWPAAITGLSFTAIILNTAAHSTCAAASKLVDDIVPSILGNALSIAAVLADYFVWTFSLRCIVGLLEFMLGALNVASAVVLILSYQAQTCTGVVRLAGTPSGRAECSKWRSAIGLTMFCGAAWLLIFALRVAQFCALRRRIREVGNLTKIPVVLTLAGTRAQLAHVWRVRNPQSRQTTRRHGAAEYASPSEVTGYQLCYSCSYSSGDTPWRHSVSTPPSQSDLFGVETGYIYPGPMGTGDSGRYASWRSGEKDGTGLSEGEDGRGYMLSNFCARCRIREEEQKRKRTTTTYGGGGVGGFGG